MIDVRTIPLFRSAVQAFTGMLEGSADSISNVPEDTMPIETPSMSLSLLNQMAAKSLSDIFTGRP